MFQGSAHVNAGEFVRRVQGFGGTVNGATGVERTNFYHSLPASQLGLGLWLEADRMRSLRVEQDSFERQRITVLDEYRERVEQRAYGRAHGRISEMSYSSFGYGHPVIGYREDLESATLESVDAFYRRWYRPDNAVLAIAGDVDVEKALAMVTQYFGDIRPGSPGDELVFDDPPRLAPKREKIQDPMARLPAVFLNHPAVPYGHPDFYVFEVLETLLFKGTSSRLRRVLQQSGDVLSLKGGYEAHRGPSIFSFFAVLGEGEETGAVVAAYEAVVEALSREPVGARELAGVLNQLRTHRVFSQEALVGRASALARSVLFHRDPLFEAEYLARVSAVNAEDILRVASDGFDPTGIVVLEVVAQ
jgi:predicted Zn-dependent peptidase